MSFIIEKAGNGGWVIGKSDSGEGMAEFAGAFSSTRELIGGIAKIIDPEYKPFDALAAAYMAHGALSPDTKSVLLKIAKEQQDKIDAARGYKTLPVKKTQAQKAKECYRRAKSLPPTPFKKWCDASGLSTVEIGQKLGGISRGEVERLKRTANPVRWLERIEAATLGGVTRKDYDKYQTDVFGGVLAKSMGPRYVLSPAA